MRAIPLKFDRLPRYVVLLLTILTEIVVAPMLIAGGASMVTARLTGGAVLAAALWAVGATLNNVIYFFVVAAGLVLAAFSRDPGIVGLDFVLRSLFIGYVAGRILWKVLQQEAVTFDTIAGSICAYMLIGLAWAPLYMLIETLCPGSFDIPTMWRIGKHGDIGPAMVYFSYITLTTVGFGDIKPSGPMAGGLVIVEAVVGPLYLAITVARLVGLHISRHE